MFCFADPGIRAGHLQHLSQQQSIDGHVVHNQKTPSSFMKIRGARVVGVLFDLRRQGFNQWQREPKTTSHTQCALYANCAAHQLNQALGDGQA